MNALVAIVGPTASGKSNLALALAERVGGEIVNADSRQVYRGMDVGTAKPSPAEMARVPHHLFDVVAPDEPFPLTQYLGLARAAIAGIQAHGLPLLVGGTGLYVQGIVKGIEPPAVPPNAALRAALEREAAESGVDRLVAELAGADPIAAERIDPRNLRRLIRAIEVVRTTGQPFSAQGKRNPPEYPVLTIGLTLERAALYRRIDRRVEAMIDGGLIQETRQLIEAGINPASPAMSGIGYQEARALLAGDIDRAEAVRRIQRRTHRLARQQYTWFRLDDPSIRWLDAASNDLVDRAIVVLQEAGCGSRKCTASATTS